MFQKNQQQCEVKSRGTTNPSFSGTIFPEIYQNEDDYLYDKSYASTPASSQIQQNFAKFLKQKMKKMQDEVKQLQTDYKRKVRTCTKHVPLFFILPCSGNFFGNEEKTNP